MSEYFVVVFNLAIISFAINDGLDKTDQWPWVFFTIQGCVLHLKREMTAE